MNAYFPRHCNSAPTAIDYDLVSSQIQCNADKIGARIFEFEESGQIVRVLALDAETARETAAPELQNIRQGAYIDLADDSETECWCGAKGKVSELYDDTGLDDGCGGLGVLNCRCGGDFCVCHYHGETHCPGCSECEEEGECV